MELVYERCCGLDVHKRRVVACLRTPDPRRAKTEALGRRICGGAKRVTIAVAHAIAVAT